MRSSVVLIAVLALATGVSAGDTTNLPVEKQQELQAAGVTDYTAGQNKGHASALAEPVGMPEKTRDTATMVYDSGAVTALPVGFGVVFGNRFAEGIGGVPLQTITLNSFSFYFAEDSIADTGLFFVPAEPLNATSYLARASINVGGLVNNGSAFSNLTTINVVPQTALATAGIFNDTFYLGAWCLNSNTVPPVDNEAIGLDITGPVFRGYTAVEGAGTHPYAMQAFNAVLRANITSPVAVPVELMAFEAD